MARHIEDLGQGIAQQARHLCRRVEGQRPPAGVELGQIAAVLHGRRRLPADAEAIFDHNRRIRQGRLGIASDELPRRDDVGAGLLMEQRAILESRFRVRHVRQRVQIQGDQAGGVFGEIAVFRDHRHDRLADIAHLAARQRHEIGGAVVRHIGSRADRARNCVYVLGDKDAQNAGRLPGFRDIDPPDTGMGPVAPAEGHMDGSVDLAVVHILAPAGQQTRIFAPLHPGADDFGPRDPRSVNHGFRAGSCRMSVPRGNSLTHGADDVHIARATADVAGQPLANLRIRGQGIFGQKIDRGHEHARRAKPTLKGVVFAETLLQRIERADLAEPLDSPDRSPVALDRKGQAGPDAVAVDQNRAGAADAVFATDMRAGQSQIVAQKIREQSPGFDLPLIAHIVHGQGYVDPFHYDAPFPARPQASDRARSARTPARWRR